MTVVANGWSRDRLSQTLQRAYGKGGDDDLPQPLRFVGGVVDLARTRFHVHGETTDEVPTVFLLHPADPSAHVGDRVVGRRIPMLHEGRQTIGSKVWFVNHVVNDGVYVDLNKEESVVDVFEWLKATPELSDLPAVVIDLDDAGPIANFYPSGLATPTDHQRFDLRKADLSLAEVREVLDSIYLSVLCTPDAQGHTVRTWSDPDKGVPVREAELTVQYTLKVGLQGRYAGVFRVVEEQSGPEGRLDLLIEQVDPVDRTSITRHVLLELKVLRSKTYNANAVPHSRNTQAIEDGVKQAAVYRDQRNVREAALCCYDMRATEAGDAMFDAVRESASAAQVELWSWHLFSSSKAFRESAFARRTEGAGKK